MKYSKASMMAFQSDLPNKFMSVDKFSEISYKLDEFKLMIEN